MAGIGLAVALALTARRAWSVRSEGHKVAQRDKVGQGDKVAPRDRVPQSGPAPVGSTGRAQRSLNLVGVTSRAGGRLITGTAREVFASAARKDELRSERQLRTTTDVVETLGSMKGAFMKIGQMASYLDASLPPEVRRQLATLQSEAPPMSAELAAGVIAEELGRSPEELFADWDPQPIAAASIGQVHRAMTLDGRAVAVKVQYPGVDVAIAADLANTAFLVQVIRSAFPALDARSMVEELRSRVGEELDYRLEAANQQAFATRFSGHPFIHVPGVLPELSTRRVLTSELVTGARYEEVVDWPAAERDAAGETIFRFVFGCLYRLQAFNGDPHPGNYLFHGGGRVTFLDFGLVKWFEDKDVVALADMVRYAVTDRDDQSFRRAVEEAGFIRPGAELTDAQIAEYFRHYYELVLVDRPMSFSADYASDTLRHFFDAGNPVLKQANVPPAFVILQRINLGLYAVLAGLQATGNWRRIAEEIWPWVAAPPSTEIGRQTEEWRVGHPTGPLTDRSLRPERQPSL